ncbi:hypothetical protein LAZ67_17000430 [Cordylochernes scorpioides]|uniref:Uncharacterized protein n=1 Tax=Cordylochernes scorpioides TaxID=51811 RepID=A0ABY6LFB2_9ARAC|nr:hypothetical protein LAZ67_17000430 [Cordylochernes scorpioides]
MDNKDIENSERKSNVFLILDARLRHVYNCSLPGLRLIIPQYAASIDRDPMTVSRIKRINRFRMVIGNDVPDLSGPLSLKKSRNDRNITRMALMDRISTSRARNQEMGSFSSQKVPVRTVRRRFQQHGLSAW